MKIKHTNKVNKEIKRLLQMANDKQKEIESLGEQLENPGMKNTWDTSMNDNGKECTMVKGTYRVVDDKLVRVVDIEEVEKMLTLHRDILIAKGWTPPPVKAPQGVFKPGDLVHSDLYEQYRFIVRKVKDDQVWTTMDTYIPLSDCRHAPTWIKEETGERPQIGRDGQIFGNVCVDPNGKYFLLFNDHRWAWMPEE